MSDGLKDRIKVAIRIARDSDDYPPADWEHLWTIQRGTDEFEVDNIPFFAKDLACGDLICAHWQGEEFVFDRVIQSSGHSTLRIIMYDVEQKAAIRNELSKLGCETEGSHLPSLIAIDVPPNVPYDSVIALLSKKADEEILDYEEAAIRQ